MTTTFNKIIIAAALFSVVFGIFGYITNSSLLLSTVSAQTTCGSCGGGGETGGGEGGGGDTIVAPTCDIKTNVTSVVAGGAYTITWNVVSVSTVNVYINGAHVNKTGSATYNFKDVNNTETFKLTAQNGGGSCTDTVVVTKKVPVAVKPTCDITANVTSVVAGGAYIISWKGTPSTGTTFKVNGTVVAAIDSTTYYFKAVNNTETYTMTGTNSGGTCTDSVTVTKKVDPIKSCDVTASATSVASGSSVTLTWKTVGFSTITINGVPVTGANGSKTYTNIQSNTTYTLVAKTADGTGSCTATVVVKCVPPTVILPKCDSFTAAPITINRGETTKLVWTTTNAQSVSINNGVGPVALNGDITVTPLESVTYTLTARRDDGRQETCPVIVTVRQPQESTFTCSNNVNFSANPTSFRRGDSSTLTWSTKNGVTSVRFNNGISATGLSGSVSVSPNSDETYVMTVSNGSQTIDCPTSVNVSTSGGGGGGSSSPRCSLKISDSSITKGERVTLKWDTTRATEITIKDNHGKTLVTTDNRSSNDKRDLYDGEITLRPDTDTTYTLVAERGSRDKTCTVKVDVKDGVTVIQNRDQQPLVTGIALTQVPYTGFEAGAFLTTLFYALLAMFAAYLAYIFVIRRDGAVVANAAVLPHVAAAQAFVNPSTFTPNFHVPAVAPVVASTATIGYAAAVATEVSGIEARAHAEMILLSADALAQLAAATNETNVAAVTAEVFMKAKASYPSEDGYVTIGLERLNTLLS